MRWRPAVFALGGGNTRHLPARPANVGPAPASTPFTHDSAEKASALLDCWYNLGGRRLDTAAQYGATPEYGAGGSERRLQEAGAGEIFVNDTKVGPASRPHRPPLTTGL
jgi:aryl-alcohol dehydrogenase-like predicted oxidoreductase